MSTSIRTHYCALKTAIMPTCGKMRLLKGVILGAILGSPIGSTTWANDQEANQDTVTPIYSFRYDWIPTEELPQDHKNSFSASCCGDYIDPMANQSTTTDLSNEPIYIEADSSLMAQDHITLQGKVDVSQGSRQIKAGYMAYDQRTDKAELTGDVEIRQPDLLLRGSHAQVNMAGGEARFDDSEFVVHSSHLRGSAKSIEHRTDGKIVLTEGSLTSCEPNRESWAIKGKQLTVDPSTKMGSGRNVTVEVAGIPILYTPYITFPMGEERKTGLLVPSISTTNSNGIDLTVPWYWDIAPNIDATIAPRYTSGHGGMLESELRYLNKISYNTLSTSFLPNDKGGGDPNIDELIEEGDDESLLRPYKGEDRWLINALHQGGIDSRWYSDIDYTRVSDVDYFRDLSTESFSVVNSTFLNQNATLGYRLPNWDINLRVQEYQNLLVGVDESYRQRPRAQFNGRYTWNTWALSLKNEWSLFAHPDPNFISGQRANIDYNIESSQQWLWGFVRPKVGIQSLAYNLNTDNLQTGADHNPHLNTPYASLDAGLFFERDSGRQTFEPRIFYLYRKYVDHSNLFSVTDPSLDAPQDVNFDTTLFTFSYDQLFRDRRFAGGDRLGDANQLTLGFTSNWLSSDLSQTIGSISLGQVIYFSDRKVSVSNSDQAQTIEDSDLATKVTFQVHRNIQLRSDFLYSPPKGRVMRATMGVEYQGNHQRRIKLDYRFVREDLIEQSTLPVNQLDSAVIWPVSDQWRILGRIFYDIDEHKELDAFIGFEYDDCCYRVRLLARRWLDSKLADLVENEQLPYDNGLFLEVDLKGLASSGNKIKKLLKETLPGFRD